MKVEEPAYAYGQPSVKERLRATILHAVETEENMNKLEQYYAVMYPNEGNTFEQKYQEAKAWAEKYLPPKEVERLADMNFFIGRSLPFDDDVQDLDAMYEAAEKSGICPEEDITRLFSMLDDESDLD